MPGPTTVLVTGGAGFIGSHTCVELLGHDYEVIVVDDFCAGSPAALERVQKIAGRPLAGVYAIDLRDHGALCRVLREHAVDAVVHLAAKEAVGESVRIPFEYYDTNVGGTTSLLAAMHQHGVHSLVFSSSCSLYSDARTVPRCEQDPPRPTNPYAISKWICEQVLADACRNSPHLSVLALRHVNTVGAHPGGLLGEDPLGTPGNVLSCLMRVAMGGLERMSVFGGDYPTIDGTGVRDYVHVMDVARGHRIALERLAFQRGMRTLNLGTGVGTSVLQLAAAAAQACGRPIPCDIVARRAGDVAALVADPGLAAREWGWRATRDLAAMCADAWRFQQLNPTGYIDL